MTLRTTAIAITLLTIPLLAQQPAEATTPQGGETGIVMPGIRKATLGGQYRLRYEGFFDYDLNNSAGASTDFFSQRTRLHAELDFSDALGAFIQLQDAREWGEESSLTDDSANGFDLHQGYVDSRKTPGIGGSTRIGRQEVNLGDQRLVGALDWATGARSLDGLLQSWALENASLLAFAFQVREVFAMPAATPPVAEMNDDAQFMGLYYTRTFAEGVDGDVYLFHLHDDGTAVGTTANISTVGTRWVIKANDQLSFGVEAATQFGETSGFDIPAGDTYAAHVHGTWDFGGEMKPRATLAVDVASGDDPNTTDVERFNNLFPTAHAHWGMMDLALWENLFSPWARFQISPCDDCDVSLTVLHLEAMESTDSFGGPRGNLSMGGTSKKMGDEIDLVYTRRFDCGGNANASVQLGLGIFLPGSGAKNGVGAGSDDMAQFFYAQFNLGF